MQLLKPLGIVDVGLATGDRLGITCVDEHHFHSPSLKNLERRDPIHGGGFHRRCRNPQPFEPIGQAMEVVGEGRERAYRLRIPLFGHRHHVEPRTDIDPGGPRMNHRPLSLLILRTCHHSLSMLCYGPAGRDGGMRQFPKRAPATRAPNSGPLLSLDHVSLRGSNPPLSGRSLPTAARKSTPALEFLPVQEGRGGLGAFPCTSRIVCAVASSFSRRATFASSSRTFASRGLRFAGFAPRVFDDRPCSEPSRRALRHAVRWELYNPSRRSKRPTWPDSAPRSDSSRIRSRYCAVNWRRVGLATTSGSASTSREAPPSLGVSSLRPQPPARGKESLSKSSSLSVRSWVLTLHRPTVIPRGGR